MTNSNDWREEEKDDTMPTSSLIGEVTTISLGDNTTVINPNEKENIASKLPPPAWFLLGTFGMPILITLISFIFMLIGDFMNDAGAPDQLSEIFFAIGSLTWPVAWISGTVWGFTKSGPTAFALGLLLIPVLFFFLIAICLAIFIGFEGSMI